MRFTSITGSRSREAQDLLGREPLPPNQVREHGLPFAHLVGDTGHGGCLAWFQVTHEEEQALEDLGL